MSVYLLDEVVLRHSMSCEPSMGKTYKDFVRGMANRSKEGQFFFEYYFVSHTIRGESSKLHECFCNNNSVSSEPILINFFFVDSYYKMLQFINLQILHKKNYLHY